MYSRFLWKGQARLIHAHHGNMGWFCLPLQKLHRLPLVVSFHGMDASALPQQPIWEARFRKLFRCADRITTPSRFMARHLEQLGCEPEKIDVIRYGLDLDEWPCPDLSHKTGSAECNLLMVARLVEKKGIPFAVEAVSQLVDRFPTARLRVVGEGPLREETEKLVSSLGLTGKVELLGARPNTEVARLMRESDALIMPSITATNGDQEGLPVTLIEAAAAGLPAVATRHAGIPEIVRDGISGFLVPERDPAAIAEKLSLLLGNEELRTRMGYAGRSIVEGEFSITQSTDQLEQIYSSLLTMSWGRPTFPSPE
jgi:colanic acid/amylovoran biosynthesis glycosyltransferase